MSKLLEAAEAAKTLNRHLRGILLVGEALEHLGSLEEEERQAKLRTDKANEALRAALSELDYAKLDVEKAKADAQAVRQRAEAVAGEVAVDAKDRADALVAAATATAEHARASAVAHAEQVLDDVRRRKHVAESAVKQAERTLAELQAEVAHKQGELAGVNEKLNQARAEAARIFGIKE
jgi:chromosome segregation ATPase